jgi:AcrR family transcriptional regulator
MESSHSVPQMTKTLRKKQRVRNPIQTRTKLLQATVDLVAEKGSEALSLKEAAGRANLSRGVAYQHFKGRGHLLREAKRWISNRMADGVRQLELVSAPLEERIGHGAKLLLNNREAAKLLLADQIAGNFGADHPLHKLVRGMLKDFQARGEAREDVDLEVLTCIMFGINAAILMLGEASGSDDNDVVAERFAHEWARILSDGIFKDTQHRSLAARPTARRATKQKSKLATRRRRV